MHIADVIYRELTKEGIMTPDQKLVIYNALVLLQNRIDGRCPGEKVSDVMKRVKITYENEVK